jgi:serine/threonine protein kinase
MKNTESATRGLQRMNQCPHCDGTHDASYLFCPVSGQPITTGEYLEERLADRGRLQIDESIKIIRDILVAIDAIHRAELLKQDLSPSNIFLIQSDEGETVKLVNTSNHHQKTESQPYCAPEQLDASRQPNPRSDIYAVGAILYRMLTGQVPDGIMKPVSSFRPEVSPNLIKIIEKALSVAIKDRYQTASEFLNALNTQEETHSADSPPLPPEASDTSDPETPISRSVALDESYELDAETNQPTVIVNMPNTERYLPFLYSKTLKLIVALLGIAAALFVFFNVFEDNDRHEKVVITVHIEPGESVITIDNSRYDENPATVEVDPDNALHTIQANADGFEQLERDIKFDKTKTVYLVLVEIIDPTPAQPEETFAVQDEATKQEQKQDVDEEEMQFQIPAAPEPLTVKEIKSLEKEPASSSPSKVKRKKRKRKQSKSKVEKETKTTDGFSIRNPFG